MRRIGLWWLITTITANVAIVSMAEGQGVGDASRGLAYARTICSECHNVLNTDAASPNDRAPAFKAIAKTPGMSITALTVWSRTSHPTMPNLVIAPSDMNDLVAYILSLHGPR